MSIFRCIRDGDAVAVKEMLQSQPELVNVADRAGDTPLHEAVRFAPMDIISTLLMAGADVNARGNLENTPLHYSSESEQDVEIAKLLIDRGADIKPKNQYGETPFHTAAAYNAEVAQLLLEKGAHWDLNSATTLGRLDKIEQLLRDGARPQDAPFSRSLPRQAVMSGSVDILRTLIRHGMTPDSNALFEALSRVLNGLGDIDIIQVLLSGGGDPNARAYGGSGETAIHYTKRFKGKLADDVISLLKSHGAKE